MSKIIRRGWRQLGTFRREDPKRVKRVFTASSNLHWESGKEELGSLRLWCITFCFWDKTLLVFVSTSASSRCRTITVGRCVLMAVLGSRQTASKSRISVESKAELSVPIQKLRHPHNSDELIRGHSPFFVFPRLGARSLGVFLFRKLKENSFSFLLRNYIIILSNFSCHCFGACLSAYKDLASLQTLFSFPGATNPSACSM